jgi:hypothetical protein
MAREVIVSPWPMKNNRQLIQLSKSLTLNALEDGLQPSPAYILKGAARLGLSIKRKTKGMTMRTLLILTAIIGLSTSAFAQTAVPKVGGKPAKQVKPLAPTGCKLVGTVKGTKLWAGDCAGPSELRGATPAVEPSQQADPPAPK